MLNQRPYICTIIVKKQSLKGNQPAVALVIYKGQCIGKHMFFVVYININACY